MMLVIFSDMPAFAVGLILKQLSWHAAVNHFLQYRDSWYGAVNSDIKHSMHCMGMHDVAVHVVAVHDMALHDVAMHDVAMHYVAMLRGRVLR